MPRPYALQVTSCPTKVSEEIWTQWYTEEHIRDLVYSGASKTSAVYRASSDTVTSNSDQADDSPQNNGPNETNFLALYQSTTPHVLQNCMSPDLHCKVRIHSSVFPTTTSLSGQQQQQTCYDVGVFKPVDLQLVEILGSYEHREDVASHILHHRIEGEEIENRIQFDHVNAVSGLEGYRRTLLYRPVVGKGEEVKWVVLMQEFDEAVDVGRLEGVKGKLEGIEATKGCKFELRAYGLIESEGFGGESRVPERMER